MSRIQSVLLSALLVLSLATVACADSEKVAFQANESELVPAVDDPFAETWNMECGDDGCFSDEGANIDLGGRGR